MTHDIVIFHLHVRVKTRSVRRVAATFKSRCGKLLLALLEILNQYQQHCATGDYLHFAISADKKTGGKGGRRLWQNLGKKGRSPKKVLRIPDLEHSKHAVINSLPARASQESYEYAIDEFISWYCSEPRLAFNRTVVLRYRFFLEQRNLAPSTINVRLAAIRRLAYEASDSGLLSPELAAGIARVKGAKRLGIRIGNWLTADQGKALLQDSRSETLRGKRDHAILAVLLGCGLRRAETVAIRIEDLQLREEHWVIADLIGKGRHVRTVPMPGLGQECRR